MHLSKLEIINFRSITSLSLELSGGANLLVGPNAVGKTTVLEAVRLAKGVLAPRTATESNQVLQSTGLWSQQLPQQLNLSAVAGDPTQPVKVNCTYRLSTEEVENLPRYNELLAQYAVASQLGMNLDTGQANLVQFLSTPFGRTAIHQARTTVAENIARIAQCGECKLFLTIDPIRGLAGLDGVAQSLFSAFEKNLPPHKALFSYFPADRALSVGNVQIQIGEADAAQQIESHNSQPSIKYGRLKNSIFSAMLSGADEAKDQEANFEKIFGRLLRDKSLDKIVLSKTGQAIISIRDNALNRSFDIDALSSGEKGVILTFLLIARSIQRDGLILLDEPELHLNPAVCRELLDFMLDEYLIPSHVQALICTHSPEIMTAAIRRDDCSVFHIKRNAPASRIRRNDQPEALQALRLLGTSEIEALLYEATVFVEGPDDVELLEVAFRDYLNRIKFRDLSGRGEVEKYIKVLQTAGQQDADQGIAYFLFDRDRKTTLLQSTSNVRIRQWDRYCLENYLIEQETLFDTVRDSLRPRTWPADLEEAKRLFLQTAQKQLRGMIVEEVFASRSVPDIRLRTDDKNESFAIAAANLYTKLANMIGYLQPISEQTWKAEFERDCEVLYDQRVAEWSSNWAKNCSGKIFLREIYAHSGIRSDLSQFKQSLLLAHKLKDSEDWKLLRGTLQELTHSAR